MEHRILQLGSTDFSSGKQVFPLKVFFTGVNDILSKIITIFNKLIPTIISRKNSGPFRLEFSDGICVTGIGRKGGGGGIFVEEDPISGEIKTGGEG
jgi:hypothetical protein